MADLVIGISKTAVQWLAEKIKTAIKEEAELWKSVERDLVFITGEFQMMQSFLNSADGDLIKHDVDRTWVQQVRDLSFDAEDCIEFVLHLDTKPAWWLRLLPSCSTEGSGRPVDEAVNKIKQLKARVVEVRKRNVRYRFINDSDTRSLTLQQFVYASAISTQAGFDILVEARDTAARWRCLVDLNKLVTEGSNALRVISVWGTGDDLGTMSIIRNMYDDPIVYNNFSCRAWLKVMHPIDAHEFIRSLVVQFYANFGEEQGATLGKDARSWLCRLKLKKNRDALSWTETSAGDLVMEFVRLVNKHRYLIILEDLSTVVQWDAIRPYLRDRKNGSRIVVSTRHHEIASLCTVKPYKVAELQRVSANQSICVFFHEDFEHAEGSGRVGNVPTEEVQDLLQNTQLFGRDSEVEKLFILIKHRRPYVVSVWGLPGSGKTAVVANVCNNLRTNQHYESCMTINMSRTFNLKDFCWRLLYGSPWESHKDKNPIEQCRELLGKHPCLVVIDEVQSKDDWDLINTKLVWARSKSCIVVITTDESVARHCAGSDDLVYSIKCLQATAALDLFNQTFQEQGSQNDRNLIEGQAFQSNGHLFSDKATETVRYIFEDLSEEHVFQNNGNSFREQAFQNNRNLFEEHAFYNSIENQVFQNNGDPFGEQAFQNNAQSCNNESSFGEWAFWKNRNSIGEQLFQNNGESFGEQIFQNNEQLSDNGISFEEQAFQSNRNSFEEQNNGNSLDQTFRDFSDTSNQEEHGFHNKGSACQEDDIKNRINSFGEQAFQKSENSPREQNFRNSGNLLEQQTFQNSENSSQEPKFQNSGNSIEEPALQNSGNSIEEQAFQNSENSSQEQDFQNSGKSFEEQALQNNGNSIEEQTFRNSENSPQEQEFQNSGVSFEVQAVQNSGNSIEEQTFQNSENSFQEQTFRNNLSSAEVQEFPNIGNSFEEQSFRNNKNLLEEQTFQNNVQAILSKSGGLPKVIIALGRYLASQHMSNIRQWQCQRLKANFMQELQRPHFDGLRGLLAWIHSYFWSCPPSVKRCMLYLLTFPVGNTFRQRRLVRRWIAEGYVKGTESNTLDRFAGELFHKLALQSVMQQASPRTTGARYEVNGFFHEYMISRPVEEKIFFPLDVSVLEEGYRSVTTEGVGHHLAIWSSWIRNRFVFDSLDFLRLRSLTVFGQWEPFFISNKMGVLRVLDLEDAWNVTNDDVEQIGKVLLRLKFLSLRACKEITRIPDSLGGLKQLQTLDIWNTSVATLPVSITKLKKLQYLRAGTTSVPLGDHTSTPSPEATSATATADPSLSTPSTSGPRPPTLESLFHVPESWMLRNQQLRDSRNGGVVVPRRIGQMTALHTLGVIDVSVASGRATLEELKNLTQLRKLGVSGVNRENCQELCSAILCHTYLESFSVWFDKGMNRAICLDAIYSPPAQLQSLKLYGYVEIMPRWISNLHNLMKLSLELSTSKREDIVVIGKLEKLHTLHLHIIKVEDAELQFRAGLDDSDQTSSRFFLSLKVLEIACTNCLHVMFAEGSMKRLELLTVHSCNQPSLQLSGLENLVSLHEVSLKGSYDNTLKEALQQQLDKHTTKPALKLEQPSSS